VIEHLKNGWTPEQIGNRMIFDGVKQRVCQETIYRHISSKDGMLQELWWYRHCIQEPDATPCSQAPEVEV
tara:strand:- start:3424 stop:3633 length:210 start_codon:yes stop_codon:yes gene_type:complete